MNENVLKQMRSEAEEIFRASLGAVNPYQAVKRFVRIEGDKLLLGSDDRDSVELDLTRYNRISIVGGGKATAPMALAVEELFGQRITKGMINHLCACLKSDRVMDEVWFENTPFH